MSQQQRKDELEEELPPMPEMNEALVDEFISRSPPLVYPGLGERERWLSVNSLSNKLLPTAREQWIVDHCVSSDEELLPPSREQWIVDNCISSDEEDQPLVPACKLK